MRCCFITDKVWDIEQTNPICISNILNLLLIQRYQEMGWIKHEPKHVMPSVIAGLHSTNVVHSPLRLGMGVICCLPWFDYDKYFSKHFDDTLALDGQVLDLKVKTSLKVFLWHQKSEVSKVFYMLPTCISFPTTPKSIPQNDKTLWCRIPSCVSISSQENEMYFLLWLHVSLFLNF